MKVFISADMEGASGVTDWGDVDIGKSGYERFRKFLTRDVNAAIEGALEAGAKEILVNEAHDGMRNIFLEELNPKAKMISGFRGKQLCMMEGVNDSFDAVFLIAYHAKAGTTGAILNHTLTLSIHNFWINGVHVGEAGISSALAGHYNVPVVLVSGDDKVCEEVTNLLGKVETAIVKKGVSRYSAECLTPEESSLKIKQAAINALKNIEKYKPYNTGKPVKFEVEFTSPDMASLASAIPGVELADPRKISHTSESVSEGWKVVWAAIILAGNAEPRQ